MQGLYLLKFHLSIYPFDFRKIFRGAVHRVTVKQLHQPAFEDAKTGVRKLFEMHFFFANKTFSLLNNATNKQNPSPVTIFTPRSR